MRIILLILLIFLNACSRAPQPKQVQIDSTPAGAVVWLDGDNVGITPVSVELSSERVTRVRLAMRGHLDWTTRLDPSTVTLLQATLVPQPLGSITFTTTPPGAELMLNGERRGQTPLALSDLAPGSYEIRCQLENFEPHVETIEIQNAKVVTREVALADKLVNFYQAQIDVEERPQTLASYTDLAHQLFVTDRTEEACGILLDGLMEMYKRGTKDSRLVAELDRTLSGQYFREGTREEIRARIVESLRGRFDLIQDPSADDLRAYIQVLVQLKELEVAKTELEAAEAFFPNDNTFRKLRLAVQEELAPTPLTAKQEKARDRAMEEYRALKDEYTQTKIKLERLRRAKLQAESRVTQALKRGETVKEETASHRKSLAELTPKVAELEIEMEAFEAEKDAIAENLEKLDYQALRRALHAMADKMRDTESTLTTDKAELERLQDALVDNSNFIAKYKTILAEARKSADELAGEFELAEAEFEQLKKEYSKLRTKHYNIIYKKKKRK